MLPRLQYLSLPSNYVTISLLNVRSIVAKLADIEHDVCLKAANVLCFCETWLTASQPSPNILNHQIAGRCDRQTNENKGGTMICVSNNMQTCHTCSFTSSGIEVACSTVTLPNAKHMQILLMYRSPSVQLHELIVMLSRLLHYVSTTDMPTVILGDLNHDIYSQSNSSIVSLMSNYGFTQLVTAPTTAKGTLVYYNKPTSDIIVQVHDTYYSDHDTVYCSIPF